MREFRGKVKCAAITRRGIDTDGAVHHRYQPLGNRKTEAGAAEPAAGGTVRLRKRHKKPFSLRLLDSDTAIGNGETQENGLDRALFHHTTRYDAAAFGEFHSVAHEIEQNLFEAVRIARHGFGHLRRKHR